MAAAVVLEVVVVVLVLVFSLMIVAVWQSNLAVTEFQ